VLLSVSVFDCVYLNFVITNKWTFTSLVECLYVWCALDGF